MVRCGLRRRCYASPMARSTRNPGKFWLLLLTAAGSVATAPVANSTMIPRPFPISFETGFSGPYFCPKGGRLYGVDAWSVGPPQSPVSVIVLQPIPQSKPRAGQPPTRFVEKEAFAPGVAMGFRFKGPLTSPATAYVSCGPWTGRE